MKEIKLTQGLFAQVDDEDFERVNQFKWHARKINRSCYASTMFCFNGKHLPIELHLFILGELWIDHKDGNGLNCQKHNMRKCTRRENQMNRRPAKNTSSVYKGVVYVKKEGVWQANIKSDGKCIWLGYFKDEVDAAKAYDIKAAELFGEFAYLNFPLELNIAM